ncbi:histidine kinase [Croceibacterium mercuriale]|uniref:histidine kinase n=1 Tax=Croceibacterium mercuriale TaxID=1572751 RepID=A0A0B2C3S0_9SPHN|nr:histidine kinase [Croceibacterium mercuriale]
MRARLLLGGGLAILLALVLAGAGLNWLFQRHIERREVQSLEAKALELLPALRLDAVGRPLADAQPTDGRFARPASGLYWQASTSAGLIRSSSLWDQQLPVPRAVAGTNWRLRRVDGPFGHRLFVIARAIRPDASGRVVVVQFATDDDASAATMHEFRREAALALLLLWLLLMGAAAVQIALGLAPLRRVQAQLQALRRNSGARLSTDHPREVAPLVDAINALADARAADLERARHRAADLAHSLKTPLAAMAAQSRRARAEGAPQAAAAMDSTIAMAGAALEAELARARGALARDAGVGPTELLPVAEAVIAVLERTERGGRLVFTVEVPAALSLPVATAELTELLGALLENAARHARRAVRIRAGEADDTLVLQIDDDGPGMAEPDMARALQRGRRLDEAGPGHGLGLAIVTDLVEASGGALTLAQADQGGLRVLIRWSHRHDAGYRPRQ